MLPLQRAAFNYSAKSPWLRPRPQGLRVRHRQQARRKTSDSSQTNPPKESPTPSTARSNVFPPHSLSEVPAAEAAKNVEPVDIPLQLWYHRLGPVTDFFKWFHRTQTKRPYTVQLGTTLTTYLCGDLLAQDIGGELYNPWRTVRMLTIGAIAAIPGYNWFLFLGRNFNYSSKIASIATKVVVNQAVFTPVFNSYFFGMQAFLTGEHASGIITRIRTTVPVSIVNSLKLWPAVTAFSFTFIAPQYRFMFSGIFAVAWQCYLSFLNRREERIEAQVDTMSNPVIPEGTVAK